MAHIQCFRNAATLDQLWPPQPQNCGHLLLAKKQPFLRGKNVWYARQRVDERWCRWIGMTKLTMTRLLAMLLCQTTTTTASEVSKTLLTGIVPTFSFLNHSHFCFPSSQPNPILLSSKGPLQSWHVLETYLEILYCCLSMFGLLLHNILSPWAASCYTIACYQAPPLGHSTGF